MVGGRRSFAAYVAALVLTGTAFADMMPASWPDAGSVATVSIGGRADLQPVDTAHLLAGLSFTDLDLRSVAFLPKAGVDVAQALSSQPPAQLFANDRSSLELCLYALIGLGLCRTAPCMRKLHIGFTPDWYHSGGAHQVGHIYAIEWDSLSSPPACYVQPVYSSRDLFPQYHEGAIVSLLRGAQFTPGTLTSRGPPNLAHESLVV